MTKKINLFIYPIAKPHVHDNESMHLVNGTSQYLNTVPMSKLGIETYFEIVEPNDADYFYMGQFSDGMEIPNEENFKYLHGNEKKHICDIEGDWTHKKIPEWLKKCTLTINGARKEYEGCNMFVRPTFSYLLINLAKNSLPSPKREINSINFGFRGLYDPHGVRIKVVDAFNSSGLEGNVSINNRWMAQNSVTSEDTKIYIDLLKNNIFSLCPMGAGYDSIRFFESCYFGSVPIIISDIFVPFQNQFKKKFFFEIDYRLSQNEVKNNLIQISQTPIKIIEEMSKNSQDYFENFIRPYFQDPTLTFINWLTNE